MRWHPDLALEIAAEFRALDGGVPWDRIEDWCYVARLYQERQWSNYGKWWHKTTAGKRYIREWRRQNRALLRATVIGIGKCVVCGGGYERRPTDSKGKRTCSRACRSIGFNGNVRFVVIDGVRKSLTAWARQYGINQSTLSRRLKRGMNIREALTAPPTRPGRAYLVVIDGVQKSLAAWARHYGIKQPTLLRRLNCGMNVREALTAAPMRPGPRAVRTAIGAA